MTNEPRCLACDQAAPINGHLCTSCLTERMHTIHPRWNDIAYLRKTEEEIVNPIINAAEARYELRRHQRTERIA